MIRVTKSPKHLAQIAKMIPKIKNAPYTVPEFLAWAKSNDILNDIYSRIWVNIDEEKNVDGFLIAQVVKPLLEDEIFIALAYGDGVFKELLERVKGWAMSQGIRDISGYVRHGEKALNKVYGFEYDFTAVKLSLTY